MSYDQFTQAEIEQKLALQIQQSRSLFETVVPLEVSPHLKFTLNENIPLALNINTTKARSSMLVTPLLIEVRRLLHRTVSLFVDAELNVDPELGLEGACEFLMCDSPNQLYLHEPIVLVVETRNEDLKTGIVPCIAKMYAAQQHNMVGDKPAEDILGVVTTGSSWKFLVLAGPHVFVDYKEYLIEHVGKIMAIITGHIRK